MKLIEKRGIKLVSGSTKSVGLFECSKCGKHYELRLDRGQKQKTCKNCRGTQNISHGMSGKPVYYIWQQMRDRCNNSNNKKFHIYGKKGIQVCQDWETFEGFWKDMEEGYECGLTIDRKDSNLGYNKENCQWLSHSQNSSKTSKIKPVTQYHVARKPEYILHVIKNWDSAKAAADELGLTAAHISVVCQGKRKTHGGYAWKYTD